MFLKKPSSPSIRTKEDLSQHLEDEVRHQMDQKAVRVGFWGGLSVDPNQVYVSKAQFERSIRVLENHSPALRARRLAREMESKLPQGEPGPSRPGNKRF